MSTSAPGWWQDPTGRHEQRYWDGAHWSGHVSDQGVTSVDPIVRPPGSGPLGSVLAVAAALAVVLIVAVVAVTVIRVDGGDNDGGPHVETPVGMAGEVAVGAGAVWVLNHTDHKVLRIDAATGETADEVDIDQTRGLAAGDDAVWVGADGGVDADVLLRLDPATLSTVAEVPLPAGPDVDAVAAGPSGVWVATQSAQVLQIDAATNEVVAEIPIEGEAFNLALGDGAAWVGRYHVVDTDTVGVDVCRVESEGQGVECAELASVDGIGSIAAGEDAVWVSTGRDDGKAVVRIDPETLEVTEEVDLPPLSVFDMAASEVAGEDALWVTGRAGENWSVRKIPT